MSAPGSRSADGALATEVAGAPLATALRWLVHGLVFLLVTVTAARALGGSRAGSVSALLVLLAILVSVYSLGARRWAALQRRRGRPDAPAWSSLTYLAPSALVWMLALAHSPDAVWIAFGLDLAVAFALPLLGGILALAVITTAAVIGYASWEGAGLTAPALIGPALGALVALAGVLAVRALQREVDARTALAQRLLAAQDEIARHEREAATALERERLARELHDTVAQSALGIQIMLDAARTALAGGEADRAGDLLGEARSAAALTSAQARALVDDSTRDVDPRELPRLLTDIVTGASTARAGTARVELRCERDPLLLDRVPPRTARTLLRLAQTLLSNAVLHADADRIVMTLAIDPADALLDVVDDGVGIAPDEEDGVGLRSARARAGALGGALTVETAPGTGTAIQVRLPLPAQEAP